MVTYEYFKGLADPIRHTILGLLSQESLRVTDLAAHFDVSRPAISRHLRVLRESGLVTEARSGRERTYSVVPGALEAAAAWLQAIAQGPGGTESPATTAPTVSVPEQTGWRQW